MTHAITTEFPPAPAHPPLLRALVAHRPGPWAWEAAVLALFATVVPFLAVNAVAGRAAGLLAVAGGFAVVYGIGEPSSRRLRISSAAGLAIVAGVTVFSAVAGSPWVAAVLIAVVAGLATFVIDVGRAGQPGMILILIASSIALALPVEPHQVGQRALWTAAGAGFAIAMTALSVVASPARPYRAAISHAYLQLSRFASAMGTPGEDAARHAAAVAVQTALSLPAREHSGVARLTHLAEQADLILDELIGDRTALINDGGNNSRRDALAALAGGKTVRASAAMAGGRPVDATIAAATRTCRGKTAPGGRSHRRHSRTSLLRDIRRHVTDRHSIARVHAERMAVPTALASTLALGAHMPHWYWVPVSTAAVLQGAHTTMIFHRALQRAAGTLLGIAVTAGVLWIDPNVAGLLAVIAVCMFVAQLFFPRNYGVAVAFVTPLALLMPELAHPGVAAQSMGPRAWETALGATIALVAAYMFRRPVTIAHLTDALRNAATATAELQAAAGAPPQALRAKATHHALDAWQTFDVLHADGLTRAGAHALWPDVVATHRDVFHARAHRNRR
ncbi:FUSC family protein [Nocardia sp. NBC_01388]|uniref:FUSC family protein n=1 Tax=Nocardia sp. NBC_01388 TaxID=2903596 RepID=UPI003245D08B